MPDEDMLIVLTTGEEMDGIGASYASRTLPGEMTLGLDVGPAEQEYDTAVSDSSVIAYADEATVYDKAMSDRLMGLAGALGIAVPAVFGSYMSDASQSKVKGHIGRSALLCLPTLATHGYEVMHADVIGSCARLLAEYACSPC